MAPSGIEPVTFRLAAQCLNQMFHRVHHHFLVVNSDIYKTPQIMSQVFWVNELRSVNGEVDSS